jgi:murein DD-endopeptidase MepM/ murein hydrolase activator NlpD
MMPIGNDLVAAAPGTVVEAMGTYPNVPPNPNFGYLDDGNRVAIDHGLISTFTTGNNDSIETGVNDFLTIYAHMKSVSVNVGQIVNRGDVIGQSGHTGRLDGEWPHVHFQAGGFAHTRVDPFRDLTGIADHISYWTKDNNPKIFNSDAKVYFP